MNAELLIINIFIRNFAGSLVPAQPRRIGVELFTHTRVWFVLDMGNEEIIKTVFTSKPLPAIIKCVGLFPMHTAYMIKFPLCDEL